MQIHCLRHGVTNANLTGRFNGSGDFPLAESQRAALREIEFDWAQYEAIYCSPLRRAVETAKCLRIAGWIVEPRIAERNFGVFEGLTPHECETRFPEVYAAFRRLDADFEIPNGESRAQNLDRVLDWLESLRDRQRVLAITHGGTIDFLYRLGSNLPVHGGDRIYGGDNAALSSFEVQWPTVRLVDYNVPLEI